MSFSDFKLLTALITSFTNENNIDYKSLGKLIQEQLDNKCGVVLFGTTGECPTLSQQERDDIMHFVSIKFNTHDFVIGIGGNNTHECIDNIKHARKYGFNKFMATTPYYNKPTQDGLRLHFLELDKYLLNNEELILYNVPGRTGVNLLPSTVQKIAQQSKHIVGIKEASGDVNQMILLRELVPDFLLYCGDDGLIIPALSIGAHGLISVVSNIYPKEFQDIIETRDFKKYLVFNNFIKLLFKETSPSPIKAILAKTGKISTDKVRLPLAPCSEELSDELYNCFVKVELRKE